DPVEVLALGRLLAVLDGGRLRQMGTVAEVAGQPRHRFAAQLLATPPRDWLEGRLGGTPAGPRLVGDANQVVPLPAAVAQGLPEGHPLAVAVRPDGAIWFDGVSGLAVGTYN